MSSLSARYTHRASGSNEPSGVPTVLRSSTMVGGLRMWLGRDQTRGGVGCAKVIGESGSDERRGSCCVRRRWLMTTRPWSGRCGRGRMPGFAMKRARPASGSTGIWWRPGSTAWWSLRGLCRAGRVIGSRLTSATRGGSRLCTGGLLTAVYVPSHELEALRDLVRAREARLDRMRARHRLGKFILRHDRRMPTTC
jgi:hypothetical protein